MQYRRLQPLILFHYQFHYHDVFCCPSTRGKSLLFVMRLIRLTWTFHGALGWWWAIRARRCAYPVAEPDPGSNHHQRTRLPSRSTWQRNLGESRWNEPRSCTLTDRLAFCRFNSPVPLKYFTFFVHSRSIRWLDRWSLYGHTSLARSSLTRPSR